MSEENIEDIIGDTAHHIIVWTKLTLALPVDVLSMEEKVQAIELVVQRWHAVQEERQRNNRHED